MAPPPQHYPTREATFDAIARHFSRAKVALYRRLGLDLVMGERQDACFTDLPAATRAHLERAGVRPEHIDDRPPCTRCDAERFYSFRRDGDERGVHMAFIGLRA